MIDGGYFNSILYEVLNFVRYAGITVITIIGLVLLITESAKSRLSPSRVFTVVASALVAAVLFWVLPDLVTFARDQGGTIVPDTSGYR